MTHKSQSQFVRRSKPTGPYCFTEGHRGNAADLKAPCDIYNGRRIFKPDTVRPLTTESIYSLTNPPPM